MRILVDIRHLGQAKPSGVGEYTKELLRALFEIDQQNAYVLFSSGSAQAKANAKRTVQEITSNHPKVQHTHLDIPNKLLNLRTLFGRAPSINQLAGGPYHLLFLPNLNITNIPPNLPTVLTIHDLSWKIFPEFFSRRMLAWHRATKPHLLAARAAHILTPSKSTAQDVEQLFEKPRDEITAIPHGISSAFSPRPKPQDHGVRSTYSLPKRFAFFMGTLEPRKNISTIIDGMEEYRTKTGDDLPLILAGKWGWRSSELRVRIKRPDYRSWIRHLGYVPETHRPALYRQAEVFLWPSFYEGFGLPVLEAMASGTPVITSATSSLPELTQSAAIQVDPYNQRDLAKALEHLFQSTELATHLSDLGVAQAKNFDWHTTATLTLQCFEKTAKPLA